MTIFNWIARARFAVVAGCVAVATVNAEAGLAADFSINFDDLTAGDIVTNQYQASSGVTFSALDPAIAGPYATPIDSSIYPGTGGVALRPELDYPENTSHIFSDIQLSFDSAIDFFSIDAVDVDEPVELRAYDLATGNWDTFAVGPSGDTSVVPLTLGSKGSAKRYREVIIDLQEGSTGSFEGGPEYFDNLVYSTVPEPGSMAGLALVGLWGGKLLKRKRQAS